MKDTSTKVWVISLDSALDRRSQFASTASNAELDWSFFDAHRELHGDLDYRAQNSVLRHGRTLRTGELGAYSSHYALWQWLLQSNFEQIVVFEDDVQVDWDYLRFIVSHDFAAMEIPYLRLYTKIPARWRYVQSPFLDRYHHLIRFTSFALGTQGYLLTKAGAKALIESGRTIYYPVDAFMDRYWEHGITNFGIYPFPIYERSIPSMIGEQRFAAEPLSRSQRIQYRSRQMVDKLQMWLHYIGPEPKKIRARRSASSLRFEAPASAK